MPFRPMEFKSNLQFGGARNNLFEIRMVLPSFAQNSGVASTKLTFMAKSGSLPASSLPSVEVPYFGRVVHVAGDRVFAPFNCTIINDEDFVVRNALESWSNYIKSHDGNLASTARPLDYCADFEVIQYGKTGNVIKTYKFISAYPTEISEIGLDWGNNNSVEEFNVTFVMSHWESGTTT